MKYINVTSTNTFGTVKLFADYSSSSVYENSSLSYDEIVMLPTSSSNNNYINLSSWSVDPDRIHDYLFSLDPHAGTGSDGTPSVFLKYCGSVLVKPLHFVYYSQNIKSNNN